MLKLAFYVFLGLVALFLYQKKKPKPSKLKLKAYEDHKKKVSGVRKVQAEVTTETPQNKDLEEVSKP